MLLNVLDKLYSSSTFLLKFTIFINLWFCVTFSMTLTVWKRISTSTWLQTGLILQKICPLYSFVMKFIITLCFWWLFLFQNPKFSMPRYFIYIFIYDLFCSEIIFFVIRWRGLGFICVFHNQIDKCLFFLTSSYSILF